MQKRTAAIRLVLIVMLLLLISTSSWGQDFSIIPTKGRVTLLDLGAKKCVPCKMMAPILVKLEKAYHGKADIVFIDVWENREQAKRFNLRAIPTQIFFNEKGEEIYRHVGFLDEKAIIKQMEKMGVDKPDTATKG